MAADSCFNRLCHLAGGWVYPPPYIDFVGCGGNDPHLSSFTYHTYSPEHTVSIVHFPTIRNKYYRQNFRAHYALMVHGDWTFRTDKNTRVSTNFNGL